MSSSKRLGIKKDAEKKGTDRRKILDEADGDETEMPRGVTEPEERDRCNNARADEQDRQPPAGFAKHERIRVLKINQKHDCEGNEENCFDEQTRNRRGTGFFSQQSVKSEREAERDGDPWETAVTESEIQDAERGEQNGCELPAGKAFAEKECAEENIHQGRHEIAKARFDDAADVDRVNKKKPIRGDCESAG